MPILKSFERPTQEVGEFWVPRLVTVNPATQTAMVRMDLFKNLTAFQGGAAPMQSNMTPVQIPSNEWQQVQSLFAVMESLIVLQNNKPWSGGSLV